MSLLRDLPFAPDKVLSDIPLAAERLKEICPCASLYEERGMTLAERFDLKNAIKRGVKYAMSIPTKPPIKRKGYILTLCPTCSKEYYSSGDFVIKRMDSFQVEKFICENCRTEYGYDYFVSKKQKAEELNKYE